MLIKINIYNQKAETVGEMELAPKIFGVKENTALVHQVAVAQLANQRKVLAHTKDRGEVRGGGRKPWSQKGTGRARHGSNRSPIWVGGGVTFGPLKNRNFKKIINKKMKQKAIFMALSDKVKDNKLVILDKFEINEYKTKNFNLILSSLEDVILRDRQQELKGDLPAQAGNKINKKNKKEIKRSILIITDKKDEKLSYSARNLVGAELINLDNINIIDLLKYKNLIITVGSIKKLEERYK